MIVWVLNIGAEKYWNTVNAGIVDPNENIIVNRVEEMNLMLCREQDVMILREKPDEFFLMKLQELGFSIPRILTPDHADLLTPISELILKDVKLQQEILSLSADYEKAYFVPYAVTALEEQIANKCGLKIMSAPSHVSALINDKIFNRRMAENLGFDVCKGKVCHSIEEISEEYTRLVQESPFFDKVIIKEPFGASGKGLYIVDSEERLKSLLVRLKRFSRNRVDCSWIVEGWYPKKVDINYQIYIAPNGSIETFSIKEQVLRDTVYIGSRMPVQLSDQHIRLYKKFGDQIGKYLFELGYTGIASIDSIITETDVIIPIIEINGRFTLSTYISFLQNILGEVQVFTPYSKMITDSPLGYRELCLALENEGILYDIHKKEGVIVYTAGTLPSRSIDDSGVFPGRLFTLIVGESWKAIETYANKLENLVDNLQHKSIY
ncbi:peptide ligase PGM1-related protein [Chengkuizengella axinellae]|uniref:Peptide ligase PGM1-related protein n=1 Tax=Chengkuizengella axinellae TaxID=3064388 RepID=A0ABT9IZ02_9BACL|nr:peptide ligase PGM1-related protein [Chengkuizengella sp. 2205SS18-9]MDP5274599.1 peptide ligase PGM1-related protein [Chengkuizengella sp. 2205SS18-9]